VAYLGSCDWDVWILGGSVFDFPSIGGRDRAKARPLAFLKIWRAQQ